MSCWVTIKRQIWALCYCPKCAVCLLDLNVLSWVETFHIIMCHIGISEMTFGRNHGKKLRHSSAVIFLVIYLNALSALSERFCREFYWIKSITLTLLLTHICGEITFLLLLFYMFFNKKSYGCRKLCHFLEYLKRAKEKFYEMWTDIPS